MVLPIVIGALVTEGYEWKPSKLEHCWDRPEYWEGTWRLEETCYHSTSSERPTANADVKNSQGIKNNRTIIWTLIENWKKVWNMKVMVIPIIVRVLGTVPKNLKKRRTDQRKNRNQLDHSTANIREDTKNNPGDLKRLAVTHTPVETISQCWFEKPVTGKIIIIIFFATGHQILARRSDLSLVWFGFMAYQPL